MATQNKSTAWSASDTTNAQYVGELEFQDNKGEWHHFKVLALPDRLLFGGACNVGFIESGFVLREDHESLDDTLAELLADLECYYNDGPDTVCRIVCNERM